MARNSASTTTPGGDAPPLQVTHKDDKPFRPVSREGSLILNNLLLAGACAVVFIGTLALLFIVPVLFISFQWLQERLRPAQSLPTSDWQIEEEMKVSRKEIEESH